MRLATVEFDGEVLAARHVADTYELLSYAGVDDLLTHSDWRVRAGEAARQVVSVGDVRVLPVVRNPHKIICLSRNYAAHAAEGGNAAPGSPDMFTKFSTALIGAYDDIPFPSVSDRVDWEAELAVIIGRAGRSIPQEQALEYVAGYSVSNDITVRDWQHRTQQWLAGKAWDGMTPIGPDLVTDDELPAGGSGLVIGCSVDGEVMQESTTDLMLFDVKTVIADVSTFTALRPGDVILTGTPSGIGAARKPPVFLRPGQVVTTWIEGVGELRNVVVA